MEKELALLLAEAIAYDKGDARRIQHLLKVHDFARNIGILEGLSDRQLAILEAAAILHDIGIHASEEKYNSSAGKYQEMEGPAVAEAIFRKVSCFDDEFIERVKYLIAHHHTYNNINGMDYQILVEADFLVNLYEDDSSEQAAENAGKKIFRTPTGIRMLKDMYGLD